MFNFKKFVSVSAVAILGVTNLLTPLTYAADVNDYDGKSNPIRTGKSFSFIMPNHDVFLKAITEPNTYYVAYHGNTNTSGVMTGDRFTYDLTGNLTENAYAKTGYTFSGWNTNASGSGTSYSDEASVFNWTAVDSGLINIYAQWKANGYNIIYDLNDDDGGTSSGVHSGEPDYLAYDQTGTIANPSRTGYGFSGWTITNMDSEDHIVGGEDSNAESATGVTGTSFKNLRATSGDVNFKAIWSPDPDTKYDVEHYLQTLSGNYGSPIETDHLSGTTDTEVRPATHTYTGFTARASDTPSSGNIKADGSTVFKYHYTRNHYDLTLVAGTGVSLVAGSGSVTAGDSSSSSTTISFLYDEPVTVDFELKSGYTGGAWTGYKGTASSFNMDAASGTKTAYATAIVYQLTVLPRGGAGATDRTDYTVEDDDIPLGNPLTRDHSIFEGWTGGVNGVGITTPDKNAKVASGSTGDRQYSAVWSCVTGYHLELTGSESESCQPDTNTQYLVNHIQQDLSGNYTIYIDTGYAYGTTNTLTPLTGNDYVGFELSGTIDSYKKNIEPDGSTVVNIYYKRLDYAGTIESMTGVSGATAVGDNSGTSPFKYEDTVELSATVEPGYTWSGWTVEDASGTNITVTDDTPTNPNGATFEMPASTVTITPHVTRDTYTIEYELYSGSEQSPNPTTYNVESPDIVLNDPKRDHSVFKGWTGTELSGTTHPVTIENGSVGNRKYYAVWGCEAGYHAEGANSCVANDYTVIIDYNDGDHETTESTGFTYDKPGTIANPEQSGYTFVGWTIEGLTSGATIDGVPVSGSTLTGVMGTEFENLTTVSGGEVTFTAQWTPKSDTKYVVYHYIKNVGTDTYTLSGTDNLSGESDTGLVLANLKKTFTGFNYSGGYLTGGSTRPTSEPVTETTIDKHGTTVIYLYYDRNKRNVYLSGDAHIDTLSGAGQYEYGQQVSVSATVKTGYHFKEWRKKTDDTFNTDASSS